MKAHGHLDLTWSGNVLYVEAAGPFNDEGAKAAAEGYIELINNRKLEPFSVIEILHNDSVGPPDTMLEVSKVWNFIGERGCKHLAIVYSNEIQRHLAEEYLPDFGRLFSNLEDAEQWVRDSDERVE